MAFDNVRLYDLMTRHQVYLEGVKAGLSAGFGVVIAQLEKDIPPLLMRLNVNTLDGLTKAKLRVLQADLVTVQRRIYNSYTALLLKQIQAFLSQDLLVTKVSFATMLDFDYTQPKDISPVPCTEEEANDVVTKESAKHNGVPLWPLAWIIERNSYSKLWATIVNAPIPANGVLPIDFLSAFSDSAIAQVVQTVTKGYANKANVMDVLREITGTASAGMRDGVLSKVANQANAVTDTIVQHVSSIAQAAVASHFFPRYMWISVLDAGTTAICRSRDGNVYRYGEGPLPPAHIRCRSKTMPLAGGQTPESQTYFAWLKSQPVAVQADILGAKRAEQLRAGKLKSSDFPKFDDVQPLAIEDFASKLTLMLTR